MTRPTRRPDERFTLHVVSSAGALTRIAQTMGNCLATYGRGRLTGRDRIVEVREGGATRYAVHVRDGRIVMFEAAGNRPPAREDVPIVRDLLERAGHLAATRSAAPARRARTTAPRGGTPRRVGAPGRATPQPRPARPTEPAGVSVQRLAAELLRPSRPGGPEWPELAAALWATGWLRELPDPTQAVWERIVLDLAEAFATGEVTDLSRVDPPTPAERSAARARLTAGPRPDSREAWQRHRMAGVLAVGVRP